MFKIFLLKKFKKSISITLLYLGTIIATSGVQLLLISLKPLGYTLNNKNTNWNWILFTILVPPIWLAVVVVVVQLLELVCNGSSRVGLNGRTKLCFHRKILPEKSKSNNLRRKQNFGYVTCRSNFCCCASGCCWEDTDEEAWDPSFCW